MNEKQNIVIVKLSKIIFCNIFWGGAFRGKAYLIFRMNYKNREYVRLL